MAVSLGYWKALAKLMELGGHPEAAAVRAEMRRDLARDERPPADSTVADWMAGRTIPRQSSDLNLLLSALQRIATSRQRPATPRFPSHQEWHNMAKQAREARRRGDFEPDAHTSGSPLAPDAQRLWRSDVTESPAWKLLSPDDRERTQKLQHEAAEVADRLAELYASARHALSDNPWHDANLARRIARRTNQLVHLLWRDTKGLLTPGEAALIALLPFIHHVHRSRTSADLSHVAPTDFGRQVSGSPERQMYEVLLHGHERLVRRAELGHLKDRRNGRREIGWWLFDQWARRQPGRLRELLSDLGADPTGLGVVLDPELLSRLLASVHASPKELFDAARVEHLRADVFQLDFDGRDFQSVRERLVGPLFAVAHNMAIEVTHLSSVIVRHVGIPDPLHPARLFTTLDTASWQPRGDGLGLKAGCGHPAVVAALTDHTHQLESLLRGIRHTADPALSTLPAYTRADEVRELDDQGHAVPVDGVIRFKLDEERVQELLMGENLYRDRSLAIRELYQNALDACRYRRARTQARDNFGSYEGRIEFVQGFDEEEGRHYLECRDNGVGMDEVTLSEVFAQAGVRFTDLPRYQEEREEWRTRGITIHPNSRFGIGVLSYFMLADEVRVTTCHMDGANGRLRELTVLISGPGHYFRVRPTGRPGTIGTTVRLYLRDDDRAPSCVSELRRLLGIAEFTTTAVHGTQSAEWKPGVLLRRRGQELRSHSLEADGELLPTPGDPGLVDGQVVWCERGGGVLVDGILTEPRVREGVLADPQNVRRLRGVVVNLVGDSRPKRLSVDRTEILDADVCTTVERLIRDALPVLIQSGSHLLSSRWLAEVAEQSPRLADIVTETAGAAGCYLELNGWLSSVAVAGFFPPDVKLVSDLSGDQGRGADLDRMPNSKVQGDPDGPTLLWRLLAQRPNTDLTALSRLVPELDQVTGVLPALPSDVLLRTDSALISLKARSWALDGYGREQLATPGHALTLAQLCGMSYTDVVARMRRLRMPAPPSPDGEPAVDALNFALLGKTLRLADSGTGFLHWRSTYEAVPPGHLVSAHFELDISVSEAAQRMRSFGFTVPDLEPLADTPDDRTLRLLCRELDGKYWLDISSPVPPGHLVSAYFTLGMGIHEAAQWLRAYGYTVPDLAPQVNNPDNHTQQLLSKGLLGSGWLSTDDPVPASHVLDVAFARNRPASDVAEELRSYGFRFIREPDFGWPTLDLLNKGRQYGWQAYHWTELDDEGSVPPGLLVELSANLGTPLHEIAQWIRELGLRPPETLPERAEAVDAVILGGRSGFWPRPGRPVSVSFVAEIALRTELPPPTVVSRLRAYGVVPPATMFPERAEPDDEVILRHHWKLAPLSPDQPVPMRHVMQVSERLRTSPRRVMLRLAQYGLTTAPDQAPDIAGKFDNELVRMEYEAIGGLGHRDYGADIDIDTLLPWDKPVPLYHLVCVAARLRMDTHEVTERLSAYGFRLPDIRPDQLDDVDHYLCLGGREGMPHPRLTLRDPIRDFLRIARSTQLPPDELLERLTRLGVDLQRVADAVRAALPKVPGLVMKPEAEAPPAQ
ncbi:HD domain-containing protein [Streptomyces diastatochromogenes]|uniref:ATP-binding protein n=1 Tax=Streptomyces diastatochromogenes TaxID=42236 RepID=A0A233SPI5_STRDA|nr:hypothetical protein [Streptomyces diastatochromogenes]MCZ0987865.1 hypothetical protein [Streptomyces diastatochromogenes]OXY97568.1 hypothetical protein BEK98_08400 [Streptomyces diastatochromogenes]